MKKSYYQQALIFILILFFILETLLPASSYIYPKFNAKSPSLISFSSNPMDEMVKIISPLSTVPVFVTRGETFDIQLEAPSLNKVCTYITTSYEPVTDEFFLDIVKLEKGNKTWTITAYVPLAAPEELYNLTVLIDLDNVLYSCTRPRAVKVLTDFPSTFTFVHVTDLHVGDPRGLRENINQSIGWKSIKKCIEEINLLQPDFVIITGDLVFGQLYPYEYSREYQKCFEILQLFDVPTLLCPGNHDGYNRFREDGLDFWKNYFGPLFYSFDYGDHHFTIINSYDGPPHIRACLLFIPLYWGGYISDLQLRWIENDLASHQNQSQFICLHHNPLWETSNDSLIDQFYLNREELQSLIDTYGVDMILSGHVHRDTVNIVNQTFYITTTTPQSEIRDTDGYWGFRMIDIKEGKIASYNYKNPKYSIPTYHLNSTIMSLNTVALATIENDLDINITAHIKFIMPLGEYNVDKGSIVMKRNNDSLQEIYVVSPVEKNSNLTITISPQV